ncbi:MAG: arylsulfatase [Pirellulaceae bacterium]|nr:arylsulfatase [Pirellulaceae bacterium]
MEYKAVLARNRCLYLIVRFAITLVSALFVVAYNSALATEKNKPNIVFILADDLGYGDVGCYNPDSKIPTPCLDRLASQGVRFTDAHDPSAVCTPTRYSILTGRYCWRSRLKRGVLEPFALPLIEQGRLTVPELLKSQGYVTAAFGKWHLGFEWPTVDGKPPEKNGSNVDYTRPIEQGPTTRGFDYFFGQDCPNYPPYTFIGNDRTIGLPTIPLLVKELEKNPAFGPIDCRSGTMAPGWDMTKILPTLTDKVVKYIEQIGNRSQRQPFFLYFALTGPHTPIVPSPEFQGSANAGPYGDWVRQNDAAVGRVLDTLDRAGLADDTLVIVTSDNGPERFAYDRIRRHGHYSMGDLRGVKRDRWEGGHRVPYIARWPEKIKPGSINDEVISNVDLLATCAALVGAELPDNAGEDSYNILPALLGKKPAAPIREATVMHSCNGRFAIRQGPWVLIDASAGGDNREPQWFKEERGYPPDEFPGELYNLDDDPSQRKNLYGDRPEIVRKLHDLLEKYKREGRSRPKSEALFK